MAPKCLSDALHYDVLSGAEHCVIYDTCSLAGLGEVLCLGRDRIKACYIEGFES